MTIAILLLSFVVTIVFLFAFRPVAGAIGLVDVPGGRKRHEGPVPLIGGIAMSAGLGFATSLIEHPEFWNPALLGIYLLVIVGTIDDRFDLPPNVRLIAQTCAALLVVFASRLVVVSVGSPLFFSLPLGPFGVPFTVLFIVTLINAFNVIDGIDGLAGGLALLSLGAMAIIGANTPVFTLIAIVLSVIAAFLIFNLPLGFNRSVRTFMGDAGSTALGLTVASVGIFLSQGISPRISPVIGLWLIAVPVFDLFSSVVRRLVDRRSPFAPDHEHLHHVLPENGLSRRGTLCLMLSIAFILAAIGIAGDALAIPDGVMMVGWLAAGTLYYQMMRHPSAVVAAITNVWPAVKRTPTRSA
jgi:UDP-GlcNAc:undecaprenyl-phosphate GlcNAc-1-phosphate transferase